MKRIIEIIRRMGKAENNAAFEFDNAAFEFDYAHSTAVAATVRRGLSGAGSSRGLSVVEAPVGCGAASSRWFRLRSTTDKFPASL